MKIFKTVKAVAPFFIGFIALMGWLIERDGDRK